MVERGGVVVVDFDGTIYNGNSFPDWIKYCIVRSLKSFSFNILIKISFYLAIRKALLFINHEKFKEKVDSIDYPCGWASDFCKIMERKYDKNVVKKINELEPSTLIVSTAAPSCYAKFISNISNLNIDDIVCSGRYEHEANYFNNYGVRKKQLTTSRLQRIDGYNGFFVFFTDHSSDIYLAKKASFVYFCGPRSEDLVLYEKNCIHVCALGVSDENN